MASFAVVLCISDFVSRLDDHHWGSCQHSEVCTPSVNKVAKGHIPSTYLCLAELAAVGRMSDEATLDCAVVPLSLGLDSDKLPVLRRRPDGTLVTFAFLAAARLLSWVSLSWRTNTPCWLRQRKYRTPFTEPSFLPTDTLYIVKILILSQNSETSYT